MQYTSKTSGGFSQVPVCFEFIGTSEHVGLDELSTIFQISHGFASSCARSVRLLSIRARKSGGHDLHSCLGQI